MAETLFPIDWEEKVNSPDLLAFLQQFGSKTYFDADQINQLKRALNNLNERSSIISDKINTGTTFKIVGTNFVLNAESSWEISGNSKNTDTDIPKPIAMASVGMKKQCIVLLTVSDSFFYIKYGDEHPQNPTKPTKDPGTLQLTDFTVTNTEVGNTTPPLLGDDYVSKNQFAQTTDVDGKFYIGHQSNYIINNPEITEVKGLCNVDDSENGLYTGKLIFITNLLSVPVPLRYLDDSDPAFRYPFYFPTESDYILNPGQTVIFMHSPVDIPIDFEYGYERFVVGTQYISASEFLSEEVGNTAVLDSEGKIFVPASVASSKPQKTVIGNVTVDNSYNGAIVKVKATANITIPSGLVTGFEFDYATYTGATATLVAGAGVTLNAGTSLILAPKKLGTIWNDGTNIYEVRGDQN
jgi:hypothetical protein